MKNYKTVDVLKLTFSVFIVMLHTRFLDGLIYDPTKWIIENALFRLAVPFFFIATGFFFGTKIITSTNPLEVLIGYIKRLVKLFLPFLVINIVLMGIIFHIQDFSVSYILLHILRSIFFYPYGSLWYILASIVGLIILYFFVYKIKLNQNVFFILIITLYLIALLGNNYYFIIEGTFFDEVFKIYQHIFVTTRNGLFTGLFFISLGYYICYYQSILSRLSFKYYLLMSIMIYLIEIILLMNFNGTDDRSLYFSFVILIPLLFIFSFNFNIKIPTHIAKTMRFFSTGIYLLHRPIISITQIVEHFNSFMLNPQQLFVIVLSTSIILCSIAYKSKNITPKH